jgi:branched-chain amino acid transport system permease protein
VRPLFKTDYDQDIRLFPHGGVAVWYAVLGAALVGAPWIIGEYWQSQLVFVCMYAMAGVGLMLLSGYAGQISLGHAAFFAAGAYAETLLLGQGVPFPLTLIAAGLLAGALGVAIGLPALRLSGIYLAIATLAFAFIVEEILARWESVTNGNNGLVVPTASLGPLVLRPTGMAFYYVTVGVLVLLMLGAINLLRSPTGRALVAIRDSEIAAQSIGVNLARFKTAAFAISAAFTGVAGAFYAHLLQFISPEAFTIVLSIELLVMIVVGGLGTLHGAVFGAIFIIVLPELIGLAKDALPAGVADQPGLKTLLFGLIIIGVMLFEPLGIYGRWRKIQLYLELFPLYRRGTFRRQRAYLRTERLR